MASCEKCWRDAGGDADKYHELVLERRDNPCTHEEQAGEDAGYCPDCKRQTVHQYVHRCLVCGREDVK